jgi:hypothetical protein
LRQFFGKQRALGFADNRRQRTPDKISFTFFFKVAVFFEFGIEAKFA